MGNTVQMIGPDGNSYPVPMEHYQDALAQNGSLAVNMTGSDGKSYPVPLQHVHDAMSQGGYIANPKQASGQGEGTYKMQNAQGTVDVPYSQVPQFKLGGYDFHGDESMFGGGERARYSQDQRADPNHSGGTQMQMQSGMTKDEGTQRARQIEANAPAAVQLAGGIAKGGATLAKPVTDAIGLGIGMSPQDIDEVTTANTDLEKAGKYSTVAAGVIPAAMEAPVTAAAGLAGGTAGDKIGRVLGKHLGLNDKQTEVLADTLSLLGGVGAGVGGHKLGLDSKVGGAASDVVSKAASNVKESVLPSAKTNAMANGEVAPNYNPADVDLAQNGGTGNNPSAMIDQETMHARPNPMDEHNAQVKVPAIQRAAKNTLQQRLISEFADAGREVSGKTPLDPARMDSVGNAGDYVGTMYQQDGARVYRQLDDVYKQTTGETGQFQKLGKAVQAIKERLEDPALTESEKGVFKANLQEAQTNLDSFTQAADTAMQEKGYKGARQAIAVANKQYSKGLSIKEVGRRFNSGLEYGTDAEAGGNVPVSAALRAVSQDGQPRGHVLEQGFGFDRAERIKGIVGDARKQITSRKAAVKASADRVSTVNKQASQAESRYTAAQKAAADRMKVADRQNAIDVKNAQSTVNRAKWSRRAIAAAGAAKLLGGNAATIKKGLASLSGE